VRIWYVGDTEYDARLRPFRGQGIDVMLVPINGGGGNMNVYEAAFLAWWVTPTVAVPMHYDMWTPEGFGPDATLDPDAFTALLDRLDAPVSARLMRPGELALFDAAKP
jgi:L-ascorbate metabolism protein UlaG (beta-lactamase superfamily)